MNDIVKMDIFFVIASVGFVIMTVVSVIVGIKLKRLIRKLDLIADDTKEISKDAKTVIGGISEIITEKAIITKFIKLLSSTKKKAKK